MPKITSASNRRVDLCDWNDPPIGKINNVDAVKKVGLWLKLIRQGHQQLFKILVLQL
jgi:hypothetical protein